MTAQMANLFEYNGEEYCVMGFTGGSLPSAADFGMRFSPCSTAHASGHWMIYGIDDAQMLVVKSIAVCGEEIEPITHPYKVTMKDDEGAQYDLNRVIPLTGFVLFSVVWEFSALHFFPEISEVTISRDYPMFEACVNEGHVVSVTEISAEVRKNVLGHDIDEFILYFHGKTPTEKIAEVQQLWDFTGRILPRKYDTVYTWIWYFSFPEYINDLKHRPS